MDIVNRGYNEKGYNWFKGLVLMSQAMIYASICTHWT